MREKHKITKENTLTCWGDFCRAAGMTELEIAEADFFSEIENAIYQNREKSFEGHEKDLQDRKEG